MIFGLNLAALGWLSWRGGGVDRLASAMIVAAVIAEPLVGGIEFNSWRIGIALVNLTLLLGLGALALRADRWWLILLTGFQLVSVLTHLIPFMAPHYLMWTGATLRLVNWCLISVILVLGVVEIERMRRALAQSEYPASD